MEAQIVRDGVLVRPLESVATNFLSSRYYDGNGIVDLLATGEDARRWMRAMADEIDPGVPVFAPEPHDLQRLVVLRETVESAYRATVADDAEAAVAAMESVVSSIRFQPTVTAAGGRLRTTWSEPGGGELDDLVAAVALSATVTVSGRAATLLRKCEAPRCVLYYVKHNSRQHWCSSVCGNRARVARSTGRAATS